MTKRSPFRYFKTSPEIIRLAVMMYVRFPLSLRNVEDFLHECGRISRTSWQCFGLLIHRAIYSTNEDAAETLDVLVVDEAAQMSLANVLAVSQWRPPPLRRRPVDGVGSLVGD